MQNSTYDEAMLLPLPLSERASCMTVTLTSGFRESAPGQFDADISLSSLPLLEDGHVFLSLSRVGCRASLLVFGLHAPETAVQRTHYGSFTDWCLEITEVVQKSPEGFHMHISLEADEKTLSPYQKAGILGGILLVQVPKVYLTDFSIQSKHDEAGYSFLVSCPVKGLDTGDEDFSLFLTAKAPSGDIVSAKELPLRSFDPGDVLLPIENPLLWSPEAPNLYQITVTLLRNNAPVGCWQKRAGLFTVEKRGQQIFLNDVPLKLRGLAYREPLIPEGFDIKEDLRLFKEANVNYLRSLYYPFSTELLDRCDELGILVEQSAPVDEVGQSLPANQNAPALRPLFVGQYQEMVLRDRSHPSILLWSLGSNCVWGDQFRSGLSLIRRLDPNRLINFHLPMTIPTEEWIPDVWSMQYGAWNLPSDVCYDQMVIFHTQGADNAIGYALGKAHDYSLPILHDVFAPVPHHDLDDLDRDLGVHEFWGESLSRFWENIDQTPGALGGAVMAAVDEDDTFHPSLTGFHYGILDAHHRPKPEYWHVKMAYHTDPFTIIQDPRGWIAENSRIRCRISAESGLISELSIDGSPAVLKGPFLHTGRFVLGAWKCESFELSRIYKGVSLAISGSYGADLTAAFTVQLFEDGRLLTDCRLLKINRPMPHQVKAGIGLDPGGLDEFGIRYLLPASMDTLTWNRKSLWNEYPSDHIGRPRGSALSTNPFDFTSLKAHINDASVSSPQSAVRILPVGDQSLRLMLTPDKRCILDDRERENSLASLRFEGTWYQLDDAPGGIWSTESMAREKGDACEITFFGTGIVVYGSTDRIRGLCDIWIDGEKAASGISQHTPLVQAACMSRGYEKRYHKVLFEIASLPLREHTCRIEVREEKEPQSQDTYISLDSFEILHPDFPRQISLLLCTDYNYPRLVLGNYMRPPVLPVEGDSLSLNLYLYRPERENREDFQTDAAHEDDKKGGFEP